MTHKINTYLALIGELNLSHTMREQFILFYTIFAQSFTRFNFYGFVEDFTCPMFINAN